ncbi:MAG: glycosyltransferase family 2 protein [Janthinobacterium lividum]
MTTIALCIPTYNAGKHWIEVLESIKFQDIQPQKKIIVDSGSSDDTVALAKKFGFEVHHISKQEFNHGKTRQQLVNLAFDTDICVFLTQDAILSSNCSIKNLISVFDNENLGIAYGRQLPHKKAKPLEIHARTYNYPPASNTLVIGDQKTLGFKVFFCSNSFSAYKLSALKNVGGFPLDSIMGEDAIVAAKMLKAGYKKAYVATASVYHSHSYSLIEEFKRYFDTRVFHEQNTWIIKEYGKPTGEGLKFVKSELLFVLKNSPRSIIKSVTSIFAKWLGYKVGKYYKIIPITFIKRISMHKSYW